MIRFAYIILISAFFFSCKNTGQTSALTPETKTSPETKTEMVQVPTISRIIDGKVHFADGTITEIEGYNDPNVVHFFAVRHCEKAHDGTGNPDLLPEGTARAKRLGLVLDGVPIKRIGTTNLKRTVQTGEALVPHVLAAPLETFPPQATLDWLDEVMRNDKGGKFVAVGHQNTIPELINKLTGTQDYTLIPADEFGNLWIVSSSGFGKSTVIHGWYE